MHVMIDLETLGTRVNAQIVQIGAVAFEAKSGGRIGEKTGFNVFVRIQDGAGTIDHDTIAWWLEQDNGARMGLSQGLKSESCMPIHLALDSLAQWPHNVLGMANGWDDIEGVWSHGATFDIAILTAAYAGILGAQPPWHYRLPRDTRTLFWAATGDPKPPVVDTTGTTQHNALDDAVIQAQQVQKVLGKIRLRAD
jgi:hypothetical protein